MKFFHLKYISLLFFAFQTNVLSSQQLTPPIYNYASSDYAAASQNWDIDVGEEGVVYAANNQGLLIYDGQSWELFALPNGSIIRSVLVHKNKIFTGSYKEFGYWEKDRTGKYFYTTLLPKLKKHDMQSEEFWEILAFEGNIYFRSFGAIYKYDYDEITRVQNVVSNKMIVYQNKLLLALRKKGLYFLEENNELTKLPGQEILSDEIVMDIAVHEGSLLIGTREKLFKYDKQLCERYNDPVLQEELKRSELNHVLALDDNRLLLGTVKSGIIDYNINDKTYTSYNRNNGLQNNTILAISEKYGNVWLGLDNGIDRIDIDSAVKFYTDDTGELGAVYDLAFLENKIYLASNTGVYTFENNQLKMIEGAEGHTWNLEIFNDTLFVNHNTGTYYLLQDKLFPLETSTGSFKISDIPFETNEYLISSYTGIRYLSERGERIHSIEGLNFPVKNLAFENQNTIWAAHPYEGLYRAGLKNKFTETEFVDKIKIPNGGNINNTDVFLINNQVAIFNGDQWFKYNTFKDSLEIFEELEHLRKHKLMLKDANNYWFSHTENNTLKFIDFNDTDLTVSLGSMSNRLVKNNEEILKNGDSLYYLALKDGYARINMAKFVKNIENAYISQPSVEGFSDQERRYELTTSPETPYKSSRDIKIHTSFPVSDGMNLIYQLTGEDTLSGKVNEGIINLKNLNHGDYELQLLAIGSQDKVAKKSSFSFSIMPPWYLSTLMKLFYVLIIIGLIISFYFYNKIKFRKYQNRLDEKFEKEHQERLNNLERKRLKNEITLKRKELVNSTMSAAKSNEMLMEIQKELIKEKDKFSNQFKIKHILSKINRAIKNEDEWEVYNTNFSELHEDFFKDLLDTYPNLTNNDLKLCSYLKLNLATKEIAPLMGISVRGVEVHRYRLRKKMNLNKDENLTKFIIKNF